MSAYKKTGRNFKENLPFFKVLTILIKLKKLVTPEKKGYKIVGVATALSTPEKEEQESTI